MITALFGQIQGLAEFALTSIREWFTILSMTRQLADLVSNFLRTFGF